MGRLRFFLKLAFICNICFLLAQLSYYIDFKGQFSGLLEHILLMGLIVAFPLNLITLLVALFMLLKKKIAWKELPPYVFIINVIILLSQFFLL